MMKKILFAALGGILVIGFGLSPAWAKKKKKKLIERNIEIQEGLDLRAKFLRPEGQDYTSMLRKQHTLLISPRRDFVNEIIESAEDL